MFYSNTDMRYNNVFSNHCNEINRCQAWNIRLSALLPVEIYQIFFFFKIDFSSSLTIIDLSGINWSLLSKLFLSGNIKSEHLHYDFTFPFSCIWCTFFVVASTGSLQAMCFFLLFKDLCLWYCSASLCDLIK